jgi:hypothetical protein
MRDVLLRCGRYYNYQHRNKKRLEVLARHSGRCSQSKTRYDRYFYTEKNYNFPPWYIKNANIPNFKLLKLGIAA